MANTSLLQGLLNNLLVTAVSCVVPMLVGMAAYGLFGKQESISKLARLGCTLFESLSPLVVILLLYLQVLPFDALWVCILGFSICFIGYMPTRYQKDDSLLKNTVVNGLGLLSTIFKWSCCAGYLGIRDIVQVSEIIRGRTYDATSLWSVLIYTFAVLFMLELAKYIAKEKL